jgi:nitrous oxidase accessory protein
MKKILTWSVILLFVAMSIIPSSAQNSERSSLPTSRGNWLYVGGSGPGNYTTIQGAIDDASDGDTVFVFNGTYYENIVLDNSITLVGENKDTTVIDGGRCGDVVVINADRVVIRYFSIMNSSLSYEPDESCGIRISESSSINISNCNIFSNNQGVEIRGSSNTVFHCIISSNLGRGVRLTGNSNSLVNCDINSNQQHGIYIDGFNGSHVSNCNIFSNNYYGIFLDGTENCQLSYSEIYDNNVGIEIYPSSNDTIDNCDIHNNEQGIQIYGVANDSIVFDRMIFESIW